VFALLAAILLLPVSHGALGRPDWAEPFLSLPTPTGSYIAPADPWVVVYEEVQFDLGPTGKFLQRHRSILENMSEKETAFTRMVEFNEGQEQLSGILLAVQRSVLWHDIDVEQRSLQAGEEGGARVVLTGAEKIAPHHRVVWEFTLSDTLGFLPWEHLILPEGLPVAKKRIELAPGAAAKGLIMRLLVPGGGPPPASFQRGEDGAWTVTSIPAASRIPSDLVYQPEIPDLYPCVQVTMNGEDSASWTAFADKYYAAWVQAVSRVDSKQLGEYAAGLCNGLTAPLDKARRLAAFVQDEVEYDDRNERAMNAWLPLDTQETLRSMKADCKGKVMLLSGLLESQGIESVPVLLRNSSDYFAWGSHVASTRVNHVINAVSLPTLQKPLPASLAEGPAKGWVLFDPTQGGYRFGEAPPGDEGVPAFTLWPGHQGAFTIHTDKPSVERTDVRVKARLLSGDTLDCDVTVRDNGGSPLMYRLRRAYSDEKIKTAVAEALSAGTSARVSPTSIHLSPATQDPSGMCFFEAGLLAFGARRELTSSSLLVNPLTLAAIIRGLPNGLPRREFPPPQERIELSPPWDARANTSGKAYELTATVQITLPAGLALAFPADRREERPWVRYTCEWKKTGEGAWEGTLLFAVPRGQWPAAERKARLQLMDDLLRGLYAPLVIEAAPAGARAGGR
jgi:transglutaminase-like putative cysteine protease